MEFATLDEVKRSPYSESRMTKIRGKIKCSMSSQFAKKQFSVQYKCPLGDAS